MRLHRLTPEQLEAWRQRRLEVGQAKYGNAHLWRYSLVDVMEELLDAKNILTLFMDRVREGMVPDTQRADIAIYVYTAKVWLGLVADLISDLDSIVPDALCTDERGGERIYWTEEAAKHGQGE